MTFSSFIVSLSNFFIKIVKVHLVLLLMLLTSVVAVDIFTLFKDCNFLADADNTFSLSLLLVMFVSCLRAACFRDWCILITFENPFPEYCTSRFSS